MAPSCTCAKRFSSETPRRGTLRELLAAQALGAQVGEMLGLALVLDDAAQLAGRGRPVEAEDLHRLAGPGLLDLVPAVVVERAHLAGGVAGDDRIADVQGPALDEHRRDGAAPDVEARLDDRAGSLRPRVRGQLELRVGDEQDLLEQVVEVLVLLGGHLGELRRPIPRAGDLGRELALDAIAVRVGKVDLVDGDDDRHLRRAGVREIDSFVCGMTPSSAATTSTARSVTFAPGPASR